MQARVHTIAHATVRPPTDVHRRWQIAGKHCREGVLKIPFDRRPIRERGQFDVDVEELASSSIVVVLRHRLLVFASSDCVGGRVVHACSLLPIHLKFQAPALRGARAAQVHHAGQCVPAGVERTVELDAQGCGCVGVPHVSGASTALVSGRDDEVQVGYEAVGSLVQRTSNP